MTHRIVLTRWLRPATVMVLAFAFAAVHGHAQEPRKWAFRAVNYEVEATLLPREQSLSAQAKVEFVAGETSRALEVELHPNLKVSSVTGADGKAIPAERDADSPLLLKLTLPQAVAAGERFTLTFAYAGPLGPEGQGRGIRFAQIAEDGSLLLLPARWFPLTDFPANRYTAVFHIVVPENVAVVGTGKASPPSLKQELAPATRPPGKAPAAPATPAPTRVVYTFRSERPEAGGTFVAGSIQMVPVNAEGLNIPVYVPAGAASTAAAYGQSVAKMVNSYSDLFGPLAQPQIVLAEMPETSLASYAAPGLVLLGPRQWTASVNHRLLAQLVARQWFGGAVLPATPSDVWLTDGLARYAEALYVEESAGKEGLNRALEDFAVGALMYEDAAPIAQAGRLDPYDSEYRSVVMNKGATVFHMLRSQLGDATFRALLAEFHSKFSGKAARIADLEKLAQEKARPAAAGTPAPNLIPFFAQWLHSTGVPEFNLEYIVYRTPKGFRVVGKVKQDLETFRMTLEVKVETEGNPELKTIEVIGSNSDFTIETFGRPKPGGIILDPNNNLLKSSPRLRVRAAIARGEDLAEQGRYYDAMQHYQRAIDVQKNNSLAHFRMGEAAFYQKNYQAAANAFRDAIEGDLDPSYKWVEVWSHIYLGKIFDLTGQRERAINEYSKAKSTNDDTGGAQAEADRYIAEPFKGEERRANSP